MKKTILILIAFLIIPASVYAVTLNGDGGTGMWQWPANRLIFGADGTRATTTSTFTYATSTSRLTVANINLSGTASTSILCLTSDSCRSTWPTGGSGGTGNVSTSTNETTKYIPYWDSTSATPALLGSDSDFQWDPAANLLSITGAIDSSVLNYFRSGFKLNGAGTAFMNYGGPTIEIGTPDSIKLSTGSAYQLNVDTTNGVYVLNNQAYRGTDTGGSQRDLIKIDTSNIVNVGNSSEQTSILGTNTLIPNLSSDGCVTVALTVLASTGTTCAYPWVITGSDIYNGNAGNVGVGTTAPAYPLTVRAGTSFDTGLNVVGNINSFFQGEVQNINSGSSVSSDWVATANNGSPTTHYIDMGINGSGGGGQPFTTANNAYLYSIDDTLNLGALGASANIIFSTTGGLTPVERARISSTGNMGIGTTSPFAKLSIGTVNQAMTGAPAFVIASSSVGVATTTQFIVTGGNIGIASTSPFAKLSVANSPGITSVPIFAIATTTSANVNTNILTVDGGGNIEFGQANKNGQSLKFWTPSSTSFFGTMGFGNDANNGPYVGITSTNIDVQLISGARSFWTASGGSRDAGISLQSTSQFSAASARMLVISNNNAAASGFPTGISLDSTWATGAGTASDTDIRINRTETSLATNGNHRFFEGLVASVSKVWITNLGGAWFNDKVGVGTTTPYAKLAVQGTSQAATLPLFSVATTTNASVFSVNGGGHVVTGGSAPTISSCGTSPSVSGNDTAGTVTVGSGVVTACTLTFAAPRANTPRVVGVVTGGGLNIAGGYSAKSTTAVTFSFATTVGGGTFDYFIVE